MKYRTYLIERSSWAAVFLWLFFSIETFLLTVKDSLWLSVYTGISLVMAYLIITYLDYRHLKNYYGELAERVEKLQKKYLLPELMPGGKRQEEEILKGIVHRMGKSAGEWVADYEKGSREYKEYIELWIHEVKVPIAAVKMMTSNYEDQIPEGLIKAMEQIEAYTEQALYYARSNDVEKDYLIRKVSLKDIVEEVIIHNKRELIGMGAGVNLEHLEVTVYSDSKWLFFILNQIVGNSMKYYGKDPLTLTVTGEERRDSVLLHIQDNGRGIPLGEVEDVFEKGFTGSNGRRNSKSTGIGLYLCRKLCRRLGLGIFLESVEGEGTRITIQFPKTSLPVS